MLNKKIIKEKLEEERAILIGQLKDISQFNSENNKWEAVPEVIDVPESDPNDMADRFEEFEARSSMVTILEKRLNDILLALKNLDNKNFGLCKICKKEIEELRMLANPAAQTCKECKE
ncbi:MAG: TraR/DksA C4-type zinc finger protein [Patescibacteria group bacterium]